MEFVIGAIIIGLVFAMAVVAVAYVEKAKEAQAWKQLYLAENLAHVKQIELAKHYKDAYRMMTLLASDTERGEEYVEDAPTVFEDDPAHVITLVVENGDGVHNAKTVKIGPRPIH